MEKFLCRLLYWSYTDNTWVVYDGKYFRTEGQANGWGKRRVKKGIPWCFDFDDCGPRKYLITRESVQAAQ